MSFVPDNPIVWFEIPVTDLERARRFYEGATGMALKLDESGPNPMLMFPAKDNQKAVAGHLYPGKPAARGTGNTVHLAVPAPLEDALKRVPEVGGKVVSEIVTIPYGRFAYCEDPDGNSVGLFAYA